MARHIHARYLISGTLTALTPLHIGGYGDSLETDLPLARNGANVWYIPGTSVAGVLRAWCEQAFAAEPELLQALWGPKRERRPGEEDVGHASFILIDDAPVTSLDTLTVEIRDGVGIDRVWGTAAEGIKYDRTVLPRGTQVLLNMTIEIEARRQHRQDKSQDEAPEDFEARVKRTQAVIGHLLHRLQTEPLTLGAARTRGLGRAAFTLETLHHQRLDAREGILGILEATPATTDPAALRQQIQTWIQASPEMHPQPRAMLDITIHWQPRGPLMVKAGHEGIGVDMLPLVSATQDGVALVLPGSSIKGALRSQAERIARTVKGISASRAENSRQRFLEQMDGIDLIDHLFGARAKREERADQAKPAARNRTPTPGLGVLAVADCYAKESMSAEAWRAVETADADPNVSHRDQHLWQAIQNVNGRAQRFAETHHVAIDRWTGGAADGMLYNLLTPMEVKWDQMLLSLDVQRLPETVRLPAVTLLLLTCRDLMSNRIPLGFGTHRGMGEIEVSGITFTGRDLDNVGLSDLADLTLDHPNFNHIDAALKQKLTQAWQAWSESALVAEEVG